MITVNHGDTNQKHSAFNYDIITLSHLTASHWTLQFLSDDVAITSECKQSNG